MPTRSSRPDIPGLSGALRINEIGAGPPRVAAADRWINHARCCRRRGRSDLQSAGVVPRATQEASWWYPDRESVDFESVRCAGGADFTDLMSSPHGEFADLAAGGFAWPAQRGGSPRRRQRPNLAGRRSVGIHAVRGPWMPGHTSSKPWRWGSLAYPCLGVKTFVPRSRPEVSRLENRGWVGIRPTRRWRLSRRQRRLLPLVSVWQRSVRS